MNFLPEVVDTVFYDILGVEPNATPQQIKRAFIEKSSLPRFSSKFSEDRLLLESAYTTLIDPTLRKTYHNVGYQTMMQIISNDIEEEDDEYDYIYEPEEYEEEFEEEEEEEEERQEFELDVSMKNLYTGCILPLRVKMSLTCDHCKGNGTQSRRQRRKCNKCNGTGFVYVPLDRSFGRNLHAKQTCIDCLGKGYIKNQNDVCRKCFGKGTVEKVLTLQVNIEKGSKDGDRVYLTECPATVIIREKKNSKFVRKGNDLITSRTITLSQALLGSIIVIDQIDGRKIITSTIGTVIKPGDTKMIEGEGFPIKNSFKRGNFHIIFNVDMPLKRQITPMLGKIIEKSIPRPQQVEDECEDSREGDIEEFGNSPFYQASCIEEYYYEEEDFI